MYFAYLFVGIVEENIGQLANSVKPDWIRRQLNVVYSIGAVHFLFGKIENNLY